ncbi:hypothetical protein AAFF_G00167360 [Aldrovandia affinis]|uniref:Uncharacterized protein n=1 Tax=Aldrovandia affinis TaxID=143900 RepID=A0AAD7W7L3_9TELE|nr:hypothetical protein AAFF_G00167360 [Aldrovandia affinis]
MIISDRDDAERLVTPGPPHLHTHYIVPLGTPQLPNARPRSEGPGFTQLRLLATQHPPHRTAVLVIRQSDAGPQDAPIV